MSILNVHFDEARQSQLPCVELLLALGYQYVGANEALRQRGGDPSKFILSEIALAKLMEINSYEVGGATYKFSEKDIHDAIDELEHIQYEGLIDTAQKIYNTIMPTSGGRTIRVSHKGKKSSQNFRFIDFENPTNNAFHVTVEYQASGKQNIRPDIVCFVNGIPFAVVENKKSSVDVVEAIHQMTRNQAPEFCPRLYTYTQLLVATNGQELLYGTTGTPAKFYAVWQERGVDEAVQNQRVSQLLQQPIDTEVYAQLLTDLNGYTDGHVQRTDRLPTAQDRSIVSLFEPARLLDLTKNHILFDAGVKKLSRYQQYFAIHKMLTRVHEQVAEHGSTRRRGGLVWHTQGSGKSLTMVMFVKALIEDPRISNPRVIIVTDRRDLDKQIKNTFKNCNLKKLVVQATSGQNLIDLIEFKSLSVVTTLVQKFESAAKKNVGFVDADQNIFVLIDEAHRTQNGMANFEMNRIIPNACYIGFTGTPLMKKDKESWKKFGDYIDRYTIDDALKDGIILPLIYEGRYVDLVQNAEQIDKHMSRVTDEMNAKYNAGVDDKHKKMLQKQITASIIKDNPQRIAEIAIDIEKHYVANFQHTGLKAQVVAPSKYSAVLFQKAFEASGLVHTAVIISDEHEDGDAADRHKQEVVAYLAGIRTNHSSVDKYEESVVESFKHNDEGVEIIIVVDKLLTGFDAPRNTVLYLAKDLRDHNLLQAIARVNRLFENKKEKPKTAGYIMDYSENAKNIDTAMKLFGNYDAEDVKGALTDVADKKEDLQQSYGVLHDLFNGVQGSVDGEAYMQSLSELPQRQMFYKALNEFMKNLDECFVLQDFAREFPKIDLYKRELKKFMELRKSVSLKYADRVDLEQYKQSLINILDKYVDARGVELLTKQINITDKAEFEAAIANLGSDQSKAEAIAAQTARTIEERMDTDPEFYEKFSKKISEILEKMREGKLADVEALKQMKLLSNDVVNKKDESLPSLIESKRGADVFYRNLRAKFGGLELSEEVYVAMILDIFQIIQQDAIVDWYKNVDVKRKMRNSIDDYLYDVVKKEKGLDLDVDTTRAVIDTAMSLAENNFDLFV